MCVVVLWMGDGVIDSREWVKARVNGTPPVPRHSHTATLVGNRIFIFGGWGGNWRLNDLWMLDTGTHLTS